nr:MAG TPA: hypothetical protein [Caudoviricetes sp.]
MIGAGKKNIDNQFSGVLMGDWQGKVNIDDPTLTNYTGLFGFQNGVMTYAFKDDGTGFIGSGTNRIDFNNSDNFISTGIFSLKKESPYFTIKNPGYKKNDSDLKENLLEVGSASYYLQSSNYNNSENHNTGTYINLNNGEIITNNITVNAGTFNESISIPYKTGPKSLEDILDELYDTTGDTETVAY